MTRATEVKAEKQQTLIAFAFPTHYYSFNRFPLHAAQHNLGKQHATFVTASQLHFPFTGIIFTINVFIISITFDNIIGLQETNKIYNTLF
jgi:hypothetical protein